MHFHGDDFHSCTMAAKVGSLERLNSSNSGTGENCWEHLGSQEV